MRKLFAFCLVVLFSPTFAQYVTDRPEIENQSADNVTITKVVLRDKYTILNLVYTEEGGGGGFILDERGFRPNKSTRTLSTERESFIRAGNKRYKFIKAIGIPISPKDTSIEVGKKLKYAVYFERLDTGQEIFDYVEGKNVRGDSKQYWNFYGVHITNPAVNTPKKVEKPVETKPTLANKITIKGKVLDAKTNKPIAAKILVYNENSSEKLDSIVASKMGEYRMELKPDAYSFKVISKGYENSDEELDVSSVTGKGSFTKNFTLNPQEETPKIEAPKEPAKTDTAKEIVAEKPIMVEDHKFRLDKVYFKIGDASLLPESFPQLAGLLAMLKENPNLTIEVEGHTDNRGDAALNKRLSLDRAFAVREYLVNKGIAGNRIKFKGYGDTKPIAPNDTEEGRQKNRRVEFLILSE